MIKSVDIKLQLVWGNKTCYYWLSGCDICHDVRPDVEPH